jgi:hypothetical protein
VRTFTEPMARVDRAVLDGDTDGFVKVHVVPGPRLTLSERASRG